MTQSHHVKYKYDNDYYTIHELADLIGVDYSILYYQLRKRGLTVTEAVSESKRRQKSRDRHRVNSIRASYEDKPIELPAPEVPEVDPNQLTLVEPENETKNETENWSRTKGQVWQYEGRVGTLCDFAKWYNIKERTLRNRIYAGASLAEALSIPDSPETRSAKYEFEGKLYTCYELAELAGVKEITMRARLNKVPRWTIDECVNTPANYTPARIKKLKNARKNKFPYSHENTRLYEYKGKKYKARDLVKISGISSTTFHARLRSGMSVEDAIDTPVGPQGRRTSRFTHRGDEVKTTRVAGDLSIGEIFWDKSESNRPSKRTQVRFNNKIQTLGEWSEELGINISTLISRFEIGMSVEEALTRPVRVMVRRTTKSGTPEQKKQKKGFFSKLAFWK